jgi:hypothetical protein
MGLCRYAANAYAGATRCYEKRCVHLGQKVPFVLACFQVSDEKDALFGP